MNQQIKTSNGNLESFGCIWVSVFSDSQDFFFSPSNPMKESPFAAYGLYYACMARFC